MKVKELIELLNNNPDKIGELVEGHKPKVEDLEELEPQEALNLLNILSNEIYKTYNKGTNFILTVKDKEEQ